VLLHALLELGVQRPELLVLGPGDLLEAGVLRVHRVLLERALHGEEERRVVPGLGDEAEDLGAVDGLLDRPLIRVAGEHDPLRERNALLDLEEEVRPVHAGEPEVRDDDLGRELFEDLESPLPVERGADLPVMAAEHATERLEDVLLVVHHQQSPECGRHPERRLHGSFSPGAVVQPPGHPDGSRQAGGIRSVLPGSAAWTRGHSTPTRGACGRE
jgi:hypothetical protein